MVVLSFGFRGLPYVPVKERMHDQSSYYIRRKVKKFFSGLGIIKKLYINELERFGRVLIELDKRKKINKVVSAINNSPTRMIKFSWYQPILKMKSEKSYLLPHKSWLFLEFDNSLEKTDEVLNFLVKKQELIASIEFNEFVRQEEFEISCQEWLLDQQIKELEKELL